MIQLKKSGKNTSLILKDVSVLDVSLSQQKLQQVPYD